MARDPAWAPSRASTNRKERGPSKTTQYAVIARARSSRSIVIGSLIAVVLHGVLSALAAVTAAMAAGELSPAEAVEVAGVVERRAVETVEIESRLAAIEERLAQNGR
jgi:hypothetical protein